MLNEIQYRIANGQEIRHYLSMSNQLTLDDVNQIVCQYMQKSPETLPTTVFISSRIYSTIYSTFFGFMSVMDNGKIHNVVQTAAGPLLVKILPQIPIIMLKKLKNIESDLVKNTISVLESWISKNVKTTRCML